MSRFSRGDGCPRTPRSVRRLLRDHPAETGIVLHRWSRGLDRWPDVPGRETVTVTTARPEPSPDDELRAWFDDARLGRSPVEPVPAEPRRGDLRTRRGPTWIGLDPGQHTIELSGFSRPLRPQTVRLGAGDRFLVAFRPPVWLPFRRPGPGRWCLRLLPDEPTR